MNEYQQKALKAYNTGAVLLVDIVDELNKIDSTTWKIEPRDPELDFTPRFYDVTGTRRMTKAPDRLRICAELNGYGNDGKWEFRASGWPTYINSDGDEVQVSSTDMYQPRVDCPRTRATATRPSNALAAQIVSRLLQPYREVYARCAASAENSGQYSKNKADALRRLTEACGKTYRQQARGKNIIYTEGNGVDSFRVEFRSEGDVTLHLTTEQAITALEAIR